MLLHSKHICLGCADIARHCLEECLEVTIFKQKINLFGISKFETSKTNWYYLRLLGMNECFIINVSQTHGVNVT